MPPTPADRLRLRAAALLVLADHLRELSARTTTVDAGSDTWVGPSPQSCSDDLRARGRGLATHSDGLAREARRLQRLADDLDAQAALPPSVR
ncbi:MAG: hypothetical protein Q8M22_08645 [Actinomycetota bacterium]|nr:hypothetical protein [Actinomycetota bacterium]